MSDHYYITTPIYYVNDKPHIGHAYTTTAADCLARFMRLDGVKTRFLTGTDEHGQKVQKAAQDAGTSPQDFVDGVSQNFAMLFDALNISHDDYIRTTQARHKKAAQHLWQLLLDKGQIYLGKYAGWYAVRDEAYYAESEIVDGKAPTGAPVEWVEESSYFFKLSEWTQPLLDYYEKNPNFIAPTSRRNEVVNFVKQGLRDLSISRTTFDWGVPVPGDPAHVMYVWFDALTNYISALGYPDKTPDFKTFWPASVHLVGKDIVRFHAVYWPAMLMAAGLPVPDEIFAHGFWTHNGQKMSKSLGNGVDPLRLIETYGVDQTRFFMLSEVVFGADGDFSEPAMIQLLNSKLANDLGNLSQRVLSMVYKNCDQETPAFGAFTEDDERLLSQANGLLELVRPALRDKLAIHAYVDAIWQVVGDANRYVDQQAPWTLRKTDMDRMKTVLFVLMETMRYIGILIQPLMPESAVMLLDALSVPISARGFSNLTVADMLVPGRPIQKPTPIFPRIEALAQDKQ